MINDSDKDLVASHGVINYLNAGYQGAFAGLNMLSRLGSSAFREGDLAQVRQALEKITAWVNDLWKGNCLFCESWTKPETFAAQKALNVLQNLRPIIGETRDTIVAILQNPDWPSNFESVKFLVAAFGQYAYSRDNYIRGFVEFAKVFNQPSMAASYGQLLAAASEEVKAAHEFLNGLKVGSQPSQQFYDSLYFQSIRLPGVFATHMHDIAQLVAKYTEPMTFNLMGIDDISAGKWQQLGLGPEGSGYWQAHNMIPEEAATWLMAGIKEAAIASEWRLFGFDSQNAAPWYHRDFPAYIAAAWASEGFDPDKALELIEKGYKNPSMIPK
jgi:hypothetical protein